jgi:Protein of unknown function (DUF4238)
VLATTTSDTRAHTVPRFYLNGFVAAGSQAGRDPYMWVGSVGSGEITRKSPKNLSIVRGLYDGQGGFIEADATIEGHLAKVESAAATAIKRLSASPVGNGVGVPSEIWRFLAWQAARTPGWMEFLERWIRENPTVSETDIVEPPPPGFETVIRRERPMCLEDPATGARHEVIGQQQIEAYQKLGWKFVLRREDHLELLHGQAWYFQVRHFPRLSWTRLQPPEGESFITSDRGVTWLVDGYHGQTIPAALRDPGAVVLAPLAKNVALVGRHGAEPVDATSHGINALIAISASTWIAGPTREVVQRALFDRALFELEAVTTLRA